MSDVCSNAAVNSDLACFLYTLWGRLKRPFLHCQADSVAWRNYANFAHKPINFFRQTLTVLLPYLRKLVI